MLTNIENRLEELFEQIEVMPPDRVEMAEKVRWEKLQNPVSNNKLQSLNETLWNPAWEEFCPPPCFSPDERLILRSCPDTGFISYTFCNQASCVHLINQTE